MVCLAVRSLRAFIRALVKSGSTARNNPLVWWMAILVRSVMAGETDFISHGRFCRNPLPMVYFSKVLTVENAFHSWKGGNGGRKWFTEIGPEIDTVDLM